MGTNYTNAVWEMHPITGMPPSAWLVFLYLADCANNHTGRCWPSMNTIAKRTKIGLKQVRRLVHKPEEFQLIEIVGNRKGGRPGTTMHFRLLVEPRGNEKTPPPGGRPMPQIVPSNPSLQREPTPPDKRTDDSLPVPKTPPTQGSQTIMNRKHNLLEKLKIKYLETGRLVLDGYGEVTIVAKELDLTLGEHDQLESTGEFAKRVRTELEKYLKSDGNPTPAKPYNLAASKES